MKNNQACQILLKKTETLKSQGLFEQALAVLSSSIGSCKHHAPAWHLLSALELTCKRPLEARKAGLKALKLSPNNISSLQQMAIIEIELENENKAQKYCQKALSIDPENLKVMLLMASSFSKTGQLENAKKLYLRVLEKHPANSEALLSLSTLKYFESPHMDEKNLESLLNSSHETISKVNLSYTLGRVYEKNKNIKAAVLAFNQANSLKRTLTKTSHTLRTPAEIIIRDFTKDALKALNPKRHPAHSPIFIVGMPRSGTTLTEQILTRHPEIEGIGERQFFGEALQKHLSQVPKSLPVLSGLNALSENIWHNLGALYLKETRRIAPDSAFVVDKMPLNANLLGFIHHIFPNAKIIHCTRNVLDTCASCLSTNFESERLIFSPFELGELYASYEALMQHWNSILPDHTIYEMNYENTTKNPEAATKDLLKFINVPFHSACLRPDQSEAVIRTASLAQVREKIHQRSVGRGELFKPYLGDVLQGLEETRAFFRSNAAT